jgi:hypothetical protein
MGIVLENPGQNADEVLVGEALHAASDDGTVEKVSNHRCSADAGTACDLVTSHATSNDVKAEQ